MHQQLPLPWPSTDERCPKCGGTGEVYYLHANPAVTGGKRVVCPVCEGIGRIRVPIRGESD